MNLFTVFQRAHAGLNLTPQERAFLKLVEGLVWTGLVAAVGVLANLLASGAFAFNQATLIAIGSAAVVAILNSVHKLSSASGDPLLSAVVGAVESEVGKYVPLHQQATPAPAPAPAPATPAPASVTPDPSASAI